MKKELKNNVNTLLDLMVTLSVMVMFSFISLICLSSCNSSVKPDQPSKDETVKEVTVHVTLSSGNGKIDSIKVNDKKVEVDKDGNFKVKYNDVIEFKAKPDDGYEVDKWTPETLKVSENKLTAKMTVTKDMKDKDRTVSVEFKQKEDTPKTVKITVIAPKEGGRIKTKLKKKDSSESEDIPDNDDLYSNEGRSFSVGDTMTFEAVTNAGYKVVKWTPETLKVSDDKLTATLTVTKNTSEKVEVSVDIEKDEKPTEKKPLTVEILKEELKVTDDSPIVTSLYGLGLIKEGDQFKYQMLENGKVVAKTGNELKEMLGSTNYVEQ